jgi:hypothetical protein
MRRLAGWVLVLAGVLFSAADAQVARPSMSIALSAAQPSFELGKPMVVHIVLKVLAEEGISLPVPRNGPELDYRISMRRTDGLHQTPPTEYGLQVRRGAIYPLSVLIKPFLMRETIEQDLDLTKMFEISRPGEYEVQVMRPEPTDPVCSILSPVFRVRVVAGVQAKAVEP